MTALVIQGDARHLPIADASVDLIVTSPPFYGLRSYEDAGEHYEGQIGSEDTPVEYIAALLDCTREWTRILKPSGSIFVNLGDSYYSGKGAPGRTTVDAKNPARTARRTGASPLDRSGLGYPRKTLLMLPERYRIACLDSLGLTARAVIVWDKANGMPESVTDRVRRSHEDWVHLTMGPRYFADIDEIREPHTSGAHGAARAARRDKRADAASRWTARHESTDYRIDRDHKAMHPLGKLPGSVWRVAADPLVVPDYLGVDHFAAFPMEWPRQFVKAWSPEGGTVVDPFGGTGTTALVADTLGRIGISVDMSADYCRIARWRTTDAGQRAKALGVEKPPVELRGQADLLALLGAGTSEVGG